MDWHEAFLGVLSAAMAAGSWVLKDLMRRIDKNAEEVHELHLRLAQEYIHKRELEKIEDRIDKRFDSLEAKLDTLFERLNEKEDKR